MHDKELIAPSNQMRQFFLFRAWCLCGLRLINRAKLAQDIGVDFVGLGQLSAASGKVAHLARVCQAERYARIPEGMSELALIAAGGCSIMT
jgi:hypothetical protein